jgi:hypothetical protein
LVQAEADTGHPCRQPGSTAETLHRKVPPPVRTLPQTRSPGDHSARDGPVTSFESQPDLPGPQSQSLSRSYGSSLPTSLTYIVLSTRGSSPWRPAADSGTAQQENQNASPVFSRPHPSAPDNAGSALLYGYIFKAPCPYLRASLFQGLRPLKRKENSSRDPGGGRLVRLCYHTWGPQKQPPISLTGFWNLNQIPFRPCLQYPVPYSSRLQGIYLCQYFKR